VQRIARGLGGALAFHPGEVEAEIGLPWPRPFSLYLFSDLSFRLARGRPA